MRDAREECFDPACQDKAGRHRASSHYGDGPCLVQLKGDGKSHLASVCPCAHFTPAPRPAVAALFAAMADAAAS